MDEKLRILVIDDDEICLKVVEALLQKNFNCTVTTAESPVEALNRIYLQSLEWDTQWYDLIIADICMPTLNGSLLAKIIRQTEPNLQQTPIIAISGVVSMSDKEALLLKGVTDLLLKPVTLEKLQEMIEKYVCKVSGR